MPRVNEIRKNRIKKLEAIKKAGMNPYPSRTKRTHTISEVILNFDKFEKVKKKIVLAGRIRLIRPHGRATFLHFEDGTGRIQAYLKQDALAAEKYQFFLDNFDIGDFIEISGTLFKTKTGEKTIKAENYTILAKSLWPLPEKWHGLKDIEERYRKRYLDLVMNLEVKEVFVKRAQIVKLLRDYLDKHGFIEVKTPILQPIYGGASARPFITHHNALDMDLYLRIADELYLKRLMVGGLDRVYEICTDFRNEGMDRWHNPEFTMLEFYWAYADYKDLMKMTEEMLSRIAEKVTGSFAVKYGKQKIDFTPPWKRVSYVEAFKEATGIDIEKENTFSRLKGALRKKKIPVDLEGLVDFPTLVDHTYKAVIRPKIIYPTFLIDHPYSMRPLAKKKGEDPGKVESLHLIIGGTELVNAYSELNDPQDQKARWEEEMARGEKGAAEYQVLDEDYIQALEYGMPPTAGWGLGIDRFTAILTDQHSLLDVILFPLMRPKRGNKETKREQGVEASDVPEKTKDIFYIDREVKVRFPDIKVEVALIKGVKVKKKKKGLEEYKKQVFSELEGLKTEEIGKMPTIKAYRKLFKAFSVDPHSRRPAPEALLRRVASGKGLYQVNNVVDSYNLAVIQTKISLGAFDLDKLALPKVLRFAKEGEKIMLLGENKPTIIHKGELIYADQNGPITLDLNYRDCDRTKITEKTKNVLLIVDGCKGISANEVEKALDLGSDLITKFADGQVIKKFVIK